MAAMFFYLPIVLATLAVGGGLDVRSGTDCPSSQAIREKLAPLLDGHTEDGDVAWIDRVTPIPNQPPALRVRLVRADANVITDRHVSIQGGCDEMADTVATVLAAWESPPTPLSASLINLDQVRDQPATDTHRPELWLGISGGAGMLGGIAAVGTLELRLAHPGSPLLGRVAMTGQTERQVELNPGEVVWRRTAGALGMGWQGQRPVSGSPWQLSTDLNVLLGWLKVSGRGFAPNAEQTVFDFGFGAGLRGQRNLGRLAVWIETRANLWPASERAVLTGSSSSAQLPKLDLLVSVGVSLLTLR